MARNFSPTRSKRARKERYYKPRITRVPISVSDEKWLDQFIRKNQFWFFGFFKDGDNLVLYFEGWKRNGEILKTLHLNIVSSRTKVLSLKITFPKAF